MAKQKESKATQLEKGKFLAGKSLKQRDLEKGGKQSKKSNSKRGRKRG
jgi:hypothetical protein